MDLIQLESISASAITFDVPFCRFHRWTIRGKQRRGCCGAERCPNLDSIGLRCFCWNVCRDLVSRIKEGIDFDFQLIPTRINVRFPNNIVIHNGLPFPTFDTTTGHVQDKQGEVDARSPIHLIFHHGFVSITEIFWLVIMLVAILALPFLWFGSHRNIQVNSIKKLCRAHLWTLKRVTDEILKITSLRDLRARHWKTVRGKNYF